MSDYKPIDVPIQNEDGTTSLGATPIIKVTTADGYSAMEVKDSNGNLLASPVFDVNGDGGGITPQQVDAKISNYDTATIRPREDLLLKKPTTQTQIDEVLASDGNGGTKGTGKKVGDFAFVGDLEYRGAKYYNVSNPNLTNLFPLTSSPAIDITGFLPINPQTQGFDFVQHIASDNVFKIKNDITRWQKLQFIFRLSGSFSNSNERVFSISIRRPDGTTVIAGNSFVSGSNGVATVFTPEFATFSIDSSIFATNGDIKDPFQTSGFKVFLSASSSSDTKINLTNINFQMHLY